MLVLSAIKIRNASIQLWKLDTAARQQDSPIKAIIKALRISLARHGYSTRGDLHEKPEIDTNDKLWASVGG